jgi:hypothetical protein
MKDQRWKGDGQTIPQEFESALREEQHGMRDSNYSHGNDYIADERTRLDNFQRMELEPSWASQLDIVGMQPHAREYLERDLNCVRSEKKFEHFTGQTIDYPAGIHFDGCP